MIDFMDEGVLKVDLGRLPIACGFVLVIKLLPGSTQYASLRREC